MLWDISNRLVVVIVLMCLTNIILFINWFLLIIAIFFLHKACCLFNWIFDLAWKLFVTDTVVHFSYHKPNITDSYCETSTMARSLSNQRLKCVLLVPTWLFIDYIWWFHIDVTATARQRLVGSGVSNLRSSRVKSHKKSKSKPLSDSHSNQIYNSLRCNCDVTCQLYWVAFWAIGVTEKRKSIYILFIKISLATTRFIMNIFFCTDFILWRYIDVTATKRHWLVATWLMRNEFVIVTRHYRHYIKEDKYIFYLLQ